MIIGLTGKKGSGKDTVGSYLVERYNFKRIAFADKLKKSAGACFGLNPIYWDKLKNDPTARISITKEQGKGATGPTGPPSISVREFLQRYGTEAHRDIFGYDFWVEQAILEVNLTDHFNYVFTDVRFNNEAEAIRKIGGKVLQVERNIEHSDSHISEKGINGALVSGVISNNGSLQNLHGLLDSIMRAFSYELHS